MADAGLTPAQLASVYRFNGFYGRGDEGQGETIGLIEYALADEQAVSGYEACTGASLTVEYVPTGSPPKQTNAEVAADIEVVAALAPKATVVVYESNQAGTGPRTVAAGRFGHGGRRAARRHLLVLGLVRAGHGPGQFLLPVRGGSVRGGRHSGPDRPGRLGRQRLGGMRAGHGQQRPGRQRSRFRPHGHRRGRYGQ